MRLISSYTSLAVVLPLTSSGLEWLAVGTNKVRLSSHKGRNLLISTEIQQRTLHHNVQLCRLLVVSCKLSSGLQKGGNYSIVILRLYLSTVQFCVLMSVQLDTQRLTGSTLSGATVVFVLGQRPKSGPRSLFSAHYVVSCDEKCMSCFLCCILYRVISYSCREYHYSPFSNVSPRVTMCGVGALVGFIN